MDKDRPSPNIYTSSRAKEFVQILHTERKMKVYGVTESELHTLTIINLGVAALFSIGTGCLAFGLDVHKDILLTVSVPEKAQILDDVIRPIAYILGVIFYLCGGGAWFLRRNFIKTIKDESSD